LECTKNNKIPKYIHICIYVTKIKKIWTNSNNKQTKQFKNVLAFPHNNCLLYFYLNYILKLYQLNINTLTLTYNDMHNTVPLRQVVPLSPVYTQ